VTRRLDHWIFESYSVTPRSLGVARILVASYLVLYRASDLRWMTSLPDTFFRPPAGPLRLVGGIPASADLTAVSIALSIATVALLVGYHTRVASCLAGLLLFVVDGLTYSFGHVHHSATYLAAVLVIMSASNWGASYSVDARGGRSDARCPGWPIALAAMLLGFLMLTAALPKIASGWLDPSTLAVRSHVVHYHFVAPRDGLLGTLPLRIGSVPVWKPLDYLTVFFEIGFAVAIFSPRWMRLFCAAAVLFHFAIFLAFGIDFTASIVAYAIFFEWSPVADRILASDMLRAVASRIAALFQRARRAVGAVVLVAGAGLYLLTAGVGAPLRDAASPVFANPDQAATLFVFAVALPLALAYIALRASRHAGRVMRRAVEPVLAGRV
jgi:uncharacterized membrane protein YphA (DoxX/SURF4 family)